MPAQAQPRSFGPIFQEKQASCLHTASGYYFSSVQELNLLVPGLYCKTLLIFVLWPDGEGCWDSQRPFDVLKRETVTHSFNTSMTHLIYRHVATAISRRFLDGGGFKRDFDVNDILSNLYTAHDSSTAGRL